LCDKEIGEKRVRREYSHADMREISKIGAIIVKKYLESIASTIEVIDVRDETEYQKKGIDFLWRHTVNKSPVTTSIEAKTDRYTTGNFVIETVSVKESDIPGWIYTSQSDYIAYYLVGYDTLYVIPTKELRDWFDVNKAKYRTASTKTRDGGKYTTVFKLVPIVDVEKAITGLRKVREIASKLNLKELLKGG
jgi:hypothetical protein